jgi:hypothetical protein
MEERVRVASMQLSRMRGMTAMYHRRFFLDVNLTTVLILVLFVVGWWGVDQAFLLVPVVALIGAVQTAFDSSYLVFARWYATYLEGYLNERVGERIHVAAELEDTYLFELGTPKIVTIPIGGGFTWFSYVTIFYTVVGAFSYLFGLVLGWDTLMAAPPPIILLYSLGLYGMTIASLLVGIWWFVGGEGERRLRRVLEDRFGVPLSASDEAD